MNVVISHFADGKAWKFLQYCLLAFLLLGCIVEGRDVLLRVAVELHTTTVDFLAAGRAALNGYVPYRDHLDVKAPGTIAIGALSLLVTGDYRFELALKIGMLLAIPVLMMILSYRGTRAQRGLVRWLLVTSAFLMGSEFMLYTVARGGNNLNIAEPFGIFFALLYLLVIAWDREKMSWLRLGMASLFMLCTIGIKEPFLLILLAMNMVIAKNMRFFVRSFLAPLGIALIVGTLILACLGYLTAYLTVDLPTILGDRMASHYSLAFRGIMVFRIVEDITQYSPIGPMMGYAILFLWTVHPLSTFNEKWKSMWLAAATVFALSSFIYFSGMFWLLGDKFNFAFPFSNPLFQYFFAKYVVSLVALIPLLQILFRSSKKLFRGVVLSGIALYLVTIAIGSGDFLFQHFLLVVPMYAAIFLLFIENPRFLLPILLIAFMPFFHPKLDYDKLTRAADTLRQSTNQYSSMAREADDLMDRCGFRQYYALGGSSGIVTFTKHSPTDLAYGEVSDSPELRKRFIERLQMAPVIFSDDDYLNNVKADDVRTVIQSHFTAVPPPCAQGRTASGSRLEILFRRNTADPRPPVELPALQLSHFMEELSEKIPAKRQAIISIIRVMLKELGLDVSTDSTTINVHMEKESIRLTLLDSATTTVLGEIVLNRADGSILSKSTASHP